MIEGIEPKAAIPVEESGVVIQPRVSVPMWRWVVGALVAPVVFLTLLFALAAIFGQTLVEVPGRWAFVPITAELAIPLAVTIWVVRRLVRPKPPN